MGADEGVTTYVCKEFCNMGGVKIIDIYAPKVRNLSLKEVVKQGFKCYKSAAPGDLIFGWGADVALYAWLRSRLGRKRCMFLSQNLIVPPIEENRGIKKRVRFLMYKMALKSKNFYVTVNSPQLIDFYSSMFDCSRDKFKLVYDAMRLNEKMEDDVKNRDGNDMYVFCGGKAHRDVDTFVKIVKAMPEVKFKVIFLKSMLTDEMFKLPNLDVLHDVEIDKFYEVLSGASLCCIPLKSEAPCGIYVMQHAILMGIPIISTETRSMRAIVPNDEYGYLLKRGDVDGMVSRLRLLLADKNIYKSIAENAKANMVNFTPLSVSKQLITAMKQVMAMT